MEPQQLRASDSSILNRPSTPYHCPRCSDGEEYYGVLVFEGDDVPTCPNHVEERVLLVTSEWYAAHGGQRFQGRS